MRWSNHYPKNCPPSDSDIAHGIVFRLIADKEPKERDFLSQKELKPSRNFGAKECDAHGLSVMRDRNDLDKVRRRVPAKKKHLIAKATLTSQDGVIKATPSTKYDSHNTWWYPENTTPWILFKVIKS